MKRDRLFAASKKAPSRFQFDHATAEVFDDMLRRSVPFYHEIQRMIAEIARTFVQEKTNVYDLGCSTGMTLVDLASSLRKNDVCLIGVDSSAPMLDKAALALSKKKGSQKHILIRSDLSRPFEVANASVVILNLTLQFIPREKRLRLIKNIFEGLQPNGCLVLVEKIFAKNMVLNKRFVDFYYGYKKRQKYSPLEISRKERALRGILLRNTCDQNIELLKKSGFTRYEEFFRWYIFSGILALKS